VDTAQVHGFSLDASQRRVVGVDVSCQGTEERLDAEPRGWCQRIRNEGLKPQNETRYGRDPTGSQVFPRT
jgi:hypothetical protein